MFIENICDNVNRIRRIRTLVGQITCESYGFVGKIGLTYSINVQILTDLLGLNPLVELIIDVTHRCSARMRNINYSVLYSSSTFLVQALLFLKNLVSTTNSPNDSPSSLSRLAWCAPCARNKARE
jgi:hypothetical protein